jgi:hypothetical protein
MSRDKAVDFKGPTDIPQPIAVFQNHDSLKIKLIPDHWGFQTEDVELLLRYVAEHFLKWFRTSFITNLVVTCRPNYSGGRVAGRRYLNFRNKHRITLCTTDWCLWSFQFAHELCHIMSNYNKLRATENAWFHESLCDLAAIFTIKQIALSWRAGHLVNRPWCPTALQDYARKLLTSGAFQLPKDVSFHAWFQTNQDSLRSDRYQRAKNGLIALQLLPILENNPKSWEAIRYLPDSGETFARYLCTWEERCPEPEKELVAQVAKVFGISASPRGVTH